MAIQSSMNEHQEGISRPLGVIVISLLLMFASLGGLVFIFLLWTGIYDPGINIQEPPISFISSILMSILVAACGIGLWAGRPWGWWMLVASYFSSIINNVLDFFLHLNTQMIPDVVMNMTMDVVRILILLALISYFFEKHVLGYFDLNPGLKTRYFLYLIPIGFVMSALYGLIR